MESILLHSIYFTSFTSPGSVETQWNEASMRSGHEWNHILYIIYIELTQIEMSLDEAGVPFEGLL